LVKLVNVKDGFARNYLLPRHKALRANAKTNLKIFEGQRAEIEARNAKAKEAAEEAGSKAGRFVLHPDPSGWRKRPPVRLGFAGRDVSEAVNAAGGARVERSAVVLDKPIKTLGLHEVKIRLHSEVTVTVTLNIARSQDEAERQARGENIINSQFEEERQAAEEAAADLLEGGAGSIEGDYVEA
jgi:large subunit ribosomal protein L9